LDIYRNLNGHVVLRFSHKYATTSEDNTVKLGEFGPARRMIAEGGEIFKSNDDLPLTRRISREDIQPTVEWLEKIVGLPLQDNMLGSVGKKQSSGDLDLGVDERVITKDELVLRLGRWCLANGVAQDQIVNKPKRGTTPAWKQGWISKSGISVHFRTPIRGNPKLGFVQTDFMFGDDLKWMKFALHSAGDASKHSGAERNLLMSSIAKSQGLKYSWQKGLLAREDETPISKHKDEIAKKLLGLSYDHHVFDSVESMRHALEQDPQRMALLKASVKNLRSEQGKKPGEIKADHEEADRIEHALGTSVNESRARPVLTEARGIYARQPGDVWVNAAGEKAQFQHASMHPGNGAFPDIAARNQAIAEIERQNGARIVWVNRDAPKYLAFGVAVLTCGDGTNILWGKYFLAAPKNLFGAWDNKETPGGWALGIKGSVKSRSGMQPQDLIKTAQPFPNIGSIIGAVSRNTTDSEIVKGLTDLGHGHLPTFKGLASQAEAVRDHLGEIMQPIALMAGRLGGDAEDARKVLGVSWKSCNVFWPQSKTHNLVDSVFVSPNGIEMGISSKGDRGAKASAANIWSGIALANETLKTKNHRVIAVLDIIQAQKAVDAPFALAEMYDMANIDLFNEIRAKIASQTKDESDLSRSARDLLIGYKGRTALSTYRIGYALLGALAKKVCDRINADREFGMGCVDFLNQTNILQIYTVTKVVGDDVEVVNFKTVFPPTFAGRVILVPDRYHSWGIDGKLSFAYKSN